MNTKEKKCEKELTDEVKELAGKLGAQMVGVGPVERWKHAPLMLSPRGLLPTSKNVITIGVTFMDASMELTEKEMSDHWYNPYDQCEGPGGMNDRLNSIAFNLSKFLESKGYKSLYSPQSNLWRVRPYKSIDHPFAPALVHRYAAVACGLGEIGWNGLFLSPEYGSRQRVIPIVTEAPLEPTPMYDGPRLCDKCMECVKRCPLDCFRKEVKKINKIDIGGKIFEFPDINKWRCYLDYYGIYGPFVPGETTEDVAVKIAHSERKPHKAIMDSGACLCSCVPPDRRFKDEKYPRAIRRKQEKKKIDPVAITGELKKMIKEKGIEYLRIIERDKLIKKGIELREYLPDGNSALLIGLSRKGNPLIGNAAYQRLKDMMFDITHYLQGFGYATLPLPRISASSLANASGFGNAAADFFHLITELPLNSLKFSSTANKTKKRKISSRDIEVFAKEKGADLVGISSARRLKEAYPAIKSSFDKQETINMQMEWANGPTKTLTDLSIKKKKVRKIQEYLPSAKSVIVLGVHFPATILETVAQSPAENIASYAGATSNWGLAGEIRSLVFDVVSFLQKAGYKAEPATDLFNTGYGANAWGPVEGITANRFAAVCAGLGEIGWSGAVLTPEYGLSQKFISIVTDAKLEESSLYKGIPLCEKCLNCVPACPVKALSKNDKVSIKIEDKVFEFGKRNRLRCDWSAKCGLIADEGPRYFGLDKSFPPPRKITADAVSDALNQLNPVEQSWSATFEKCLNACPVTTKLFPPQQG